MATPLPARAAGIIEGSDWDLLTQDFLGTGINRYPASYVVFTDGVTVYAQNGETGELDFSGVDASTVINAALGAMVDGGKMLVREGTYELSASLTIDDYVWFSGESFAGTRFNYTGAANAINVVGEHVRLEEFTVYSDKTNVNGINMDVDGVTNMVLITLLHVHSYNHGQDNFYVRLPVLITFIHCHSFNAGRCGYYIYGGTTTTLLNCWGLSNDQWAFWGRSITNLNILGGASELSGHATYGSYFNDCRALKIEGVDFEESAGASYCLGVVESYDPRVIGNHLAYAGAGVYFSGNFGGVIAGNWPNALTGANAIVTTASNDGTVIRDNHVSAYNILALGADVVKDNHGYNPQAASAPAVGASPVTFGPYVYPVLIEVAGGNVTSVTVRTQASSLTAGQWMLYPGDTCVIVYAVAPTVTLWPQ